MGQHNLPSCKLNVYDHAVRIPMLIRGPGVQAQQRFSQIGESGPQHIHCTYNCYGVWLCTMSRHNHFVNVGSNVDVAPTLLALAGLDPAKFTNPPMDGKSLMPWLLASVPHDDGYNGTAGRLAGATRTQLAIERARLGITAAAVAAAAVGDAEAALPRVRAAHWIEFYSLGNLHMCGGGTFNGSAFNTSAGCGPGCPGTGHDPLAPDLIIGSTCQGDRPDVQGYCHSPCHHTATGAVPMHDASCDMRVCVNITCCGANHTEFSSLEGMRCGAGHKNGSLPFDSSMDPGHQVDSTESNTFRALRFVDPTRGGASESPACKSFCLPACILECLAT